jgi:hypothetical protein
MVKIQTTNERGSRSQFHSPRFPLGEDDNKTDLKKKKSPLPLLNLIPKLLEILSLKKRKTSLSEKETEVNCVIYLRYVVLGNL